MSLIEQCVLIADKRAQHSRQRYQGSFVSIISIFLCMLHLSSFTNCSKQLNLAEYFASVTF